MLPCFFKPMAEPNTHFPPTTSQEQRTKTNEELSHTGAVWSLGINQRWNETQLKFW